MSRACERRATPLFLIENVYFLWRTDGTGPRKGIIMQQSPLFNQTDTPNTNASVSNYCRNREKCRNLPFFRLVDLQLIASSSSLSLAHNLVHALRFHHRRMQKTTVGHGSESSQFRLLLLALLINIALRNGTRTRSHHQTSRCPSESVCEKCRVKRRCARNSLSKRWRLHSDHSRRGV